MEYKGNYKGKHLYTSDQKLKWFGHGEWVEEVDQVFFTHQGIECMIIRKIVLEPYNPTHTFGGYFCGYCKVPEGHPYHNKSVFEGELSNVEVHGGLTYGQMEDDGYWIGFDCCHSFDITPSMQKCYKQIEEDLISKFPSIKNSPVLCRQYRNIAYCVEQCKSMAEQIIGASVVRD